MCYKFSLLFIADFKRNVRFLILEECKSIKRITIVHIVTKIIFEMHFFFFFFFFLKEICNDSWGRINSSDDGEKNFWCRYRRDVQYNLIVFEDSRNTSVQYEDDICLP